MATINWKYATAILAIGAGALAIAGCSESPKSGQVKDEALVAGRTADTLKGVDGTGDDLLADMDYGYRRNTDPSVKLDAAGVRGRVSWIMWTFGNDRFWDYMANHTFGAFDLLKILSTHSAIGYCTEDYSGRHDNKYEGSAYAGMDEAQCKAAGKTWALTRDHRWKYYGLVNEPCMDKPTAPDEYGLWLDKRAPVSAECPKDPYEDETKYPGVKHRARGSTVPVGSYYGKPSGIVGLRLFPNPDFDDAAKRKWDANRYYTDPKFYNDKNLVRPYRVGMSCGFCHVGPNPMQPAGGSGKSQLGQPELQSRRPVFLGRPHLHLEPEATSNELHLPAVPHLAARLARHLVRLDRQHQQSAHDERGLQRPAPGWRRAGSGRRSSPAASSTTSSSRTSRRRRRCRGLFQAPDTVLTPHVLKDGSDSVGALGALNRVFINIGLFSEEWLLHFRPLVGGKRISPIRIADLREELGLLAGDGATRRRTWRCSS